MTETLHLSRLKARYRLPPGHPDAPARLDRLLREVADDALESALARCAVPAHEEICIRAVHVPVELRMAAPDSALIAAWSVALAGSIGRVIEEGGPDVVRYRTRTHALTDVVLGVAVGDYARAWAWRRLDLWRIGDTPAPAAAVAEVVRALLATPQSIVPAVAAAARAGALPRLLDLVPGPSWSRLGAAALGTRALPSVPPPPPLHPGSMDELEARAIAEVRASRIVAVSAIAGAVRRLPYCAPDLRPLLAVLAVLEVDPTELDRGYPGTSEMLLRIEAETDARRGDPTVSWEPAPTETAPTPAPPAPPPPSAATSRAHRPAPAEAPDAAAGDEASEERPLPELPREVATQCGGLLFLLHIVDELRLPAEILRAEVFRARTLRWVLHRLAMVLSGAEVRDAACLAFCATPPRGPAPLDEEYPPTGEEDRAVGELAARVAARLHERLRGEPARDAAAARVLMRSVVRRHARVSCTPGWFHLLLRLDEVSVEVRRAGLDLDPGWVPWLGAVVRFVYE